MTDALVRLTSALCDRNTIERELGSGGMASSAGRVVSGQGLKVLRREVPKRSPALRVQR